MIASPIAAAPRAAAKLPANPLTGIAGRSMVGLLDGPPEDGSGIMIAAGKQLLGNPEGYRHVSQALRDLAKVTAGEQHDAAIVVKSGDRFYGVDSKAVSQWRDEDGQHTRTDAWAFESQQPAVLITSTAPQAYAMVDGRRRMLLQDEHYPNAVLYAKPTNIPAEPGNRSPLDLGRFRVSTGFDEDVRLQIGAQVGPAAGYATREEAVAAALKASQSQQAPGLVVSTYGDRAFTNYALVSRYDAELGGGSTQFLRLQEWFRAAPAKLPLDGPQNRHVDAIVDNGTRYDFATRPGKTAR